MQTFDIAKMQLFLICSTAKLYIISGTDCNVVLATHEVAEATKHILLNLPVSNSHYREGRVYLFHSQWVMYWLCNLLLGLL